jgi:hypothetical protein
VLFPRPQARRCGPGRPHRQLSVVLVAIFAAVFLGERPSRPGWLGIFLITTGAVLIAIKPQGNSRVGTSSRDMPSTIQHRPVFVERNSVFGLSAYSYMSSHLPEPAMVRPLNLRWLPRCASQQFSALGQFLPYPLFRVDASPYSLIIDRAAEPGTCRTPISSGSDHAVGGHALSATNRICATCTGGTHG